MNAMMTAQDPPHSAEAPAGGGELASSRLRSLRLADQERPSSGSTWLAARTWWIIGGAAALTALLGWAGWRFLQREPPREVDAIRVGDAGKSEVILSLSGYLIPTARVSISPLVAGKLLEIPVQEGQQVSQGALLARIDATSYLADLAQAEAMLKTASSRLEELQNGPRPEELAQMEELLGQARVQLDLIRKEADRNLQLEGTLPQGVLDASKANLERAEGEVRSLEQKQKLLTSPPRAETLQAATGEVERAAAAVSRAKYFVDNTRIVAPISGTVLELNGNVGEVVRPEGLSTPFCLLADLSRMEADVDVQERDLPRVQVEQPCRVIPDAFPDRSYTGKLVRLQAQVNRQRGIVKARVEVSAPAGELLAEMNCRVEFLPFPSANASELRIPARAVRKDSAGEFVLIADAGRAARRNVKLKTGDGDFRPVESGLSSDDVVLLGDAAELSEGDSVEPRLPQ